MISAVLDYDVIFPCVQKYRLWRFTAPSIPVASGDEIEVTLALPLRMENLHISCASKNFNVSIRKLPSIVLPSIEEVYGIEQQHFDLLDDNLNLYLAKPAGPGEDKIYIDFLNVDADVATGPIGIEIAAACF